MDTFRYLSEARLNVQKGNDTTEIWKHLKKLTASMLEEGASAGLRRAYNKLIRELGERSSQVAPQSELSSVFIQYLEKHKKAWPNRVVAVYGLKALCDIDNDNVKGIRRNAFIILADYIKNPGTHLTYKLALLEALNSAYVSSLDYAVVKQVWKAARSLVFDPSIMVSKAAIKLMETIVRPEILKTPSKFEKLNSMCMKAFNQDLPVAHLLANASFIVEKSTELTLTSIMAQKCSEYPISPIPVANGIVEFLAECLRRSPPQDYSAAISMITSIFQNPKMRDEHRLSLAFEHVHELVAQVIGNSLLEQKQKIALVQSLVKRLATTDKHHQLLCACLVPCLATLLEHVVLSAPLADIIYQATTALLEMSTIPELTLRIIDFMRYFLRAAPRYYMPLGTYCLDKLDTSEKLEYAYILGAALIQANTCDHEMMELKPKIVEKAMSLVKQKGGKFSLDPYRQGWVLLRSFCSTPAEALRLFIPHYLSLFSHTLVVPEKKAGNELRYQVEIWKPALDCLLEFGTTSLITPDISRKLGSLLQELWNFIEKCPAQTFEEEPLIGEDVQVRGRILQCYSSINFHGDSHNFPATLLTGSFNSICRSEETSSYLAGVVNLDYSKDYKNNPISVICGKPAVPPSIHALDMSIDVVVATLPMQLDRVKESLLDALRAHVESSISSKKFYGNVSYLFFRLCEQKYTEPRLVRTIDSVLKLLVQDGAPFYREVTENCVKNHPEISTDLAKYLLDQIMSTADRPLVRGNSCTALTAVIKHGGLNSRNLKEVYGLVSSLAKDPHPAVHTAAIGAIMASSSSSGLLGTREALNLLESLTTLYISDTHSVETSVLEYSNLEATTYNTWSRLSEGLTALVSLIGPNLQEENSLFEMLYHLIDQLEDFSDITTKCSWDCFQEFFYYAKDRMNWLKIINGWRYSIIHSTHPFPIYYDSALQGILLFANRAASKLFELTGPKFERELWLAYDLQPSVHIKQIFSVWAEQTILVEPQLWIARLHQVISKPRRFTDQITDRDDHNLDNVEVDEEEESLGVQSDQGNNDLFNPETRTLALEILIAMTESQLHGKTKAARQDSLISQNIGDIIKIAFNAATSTVLKLQLSGLNLLNILIKQLYDLADPDFPEVSLLEQYQAQISSALTPAFNADSSYELASAVIDVCANFVGCGIVKNVEKFNKILKILTDPLKSDTNIVGKLQLDELSATTLKIKICKFWAVLETDKNNVALEKEDVLGKLWVNALTEYTKLEFRPEQQSYTSFFVEGVDKLIRYNKRQVLLPVYRDSWVDMVSALAVLVERHGSDIITENGDFMLGLVGLCFSELLKKGSTNTLSVLTALKEILQPGVCASLVYDNDIFHEVVEVFDRIVLTGSVAERACIIEIARNLTRSQGESDDSVDHLFEIFRTCIFPLKEQFPFLTDPKLSISPKAEQEMGLTKLALESLIDMVPVFREVIQNDQYFCLLFIFEQIFSNKKAQNKIVPHIFSSYKRLIEVMDEAYLQNVDSRPLIQWAICNTLANSTELLRSTEDDATATNTMLTCMVVLCSAGSILEPAIGNVQLLGELLAKFACRNMYVAVQCVRTILRSKIPATVLDAFVYGCIPELTEQLSEQRDDLPKDICNLLVEYTKNTHDPSTAFSIVIPALIHVLHSQWDTEERRNMYIGALLFTLVESHPQTFKQHMSVISGEDRGVIQKLLMDPPEPDVEKETSSEITLTSFS